MPRLGLVRAASRSVLLATIGFVVARCNPSSSAPGTATACEPGAVRTCTAPTGCAAEERCNAAGTGYDACVCVGGSSGDAGSHPSLDAALERDAAPMSSGGGAGGDAASMSYADSGCVDACDLSAPMTCNDAVLQSCWLSPLGGCANSLTSPCQRRSCGDENHCAECVNECTSVGVTGCAHGALGTCVRDAEGCLKWQRNSECPSGFCADDKLCGTCANACDTVGQVECQDGESRVCVADRYGCRSLSEWSECPVLACASASQCLPGYSLGQRGTPLDDEALAVIVDERGVEASVGSYHQFGAAGYNLDSDAYLQARTADGTLLKDVKWGSPADDSALCVGADSQGNHLVAGWTAGRIDVNPHHGGTDAFLAKWGDDYTKPVWLRQWGTSANDVARALQVDKNDAVFVVGSTGGQIGTDPPLGDDDLFVTKWDSMGNKLWTKQWGTARADVPTAAALDAAGHLWIAGRTAGQLATTASLGDYDAFFTELDADGNVLMTHQFGTPQGDAAEGIALDQDGNVFVAGFTQGNLDGNPTTGGIDAFVAKFTAAGTPLWSKLWGTTSDDFAEDLALDRAGDPYIAVSSRATAGPSCPPGEAWAVGWDANGKSTLQQSWDSCGVEAANGIAVRADGQILVVGSSTGDLVHDTRGGKDIISITLQPN